MLLNIFLNEPLRSKKVNESSKRHGKYVPNTIEHTGVINVWVCQKYKELNLLSGRGIKLLSTKIVSGSIFKVLDWDSRHINSAEPKVIWASNPDE